MQKRRFVARNFLFCFLLLGTVFAQPPTKKRVNSQTDLPRFNYSVKGSASELVQAENATFDVFAKKVQADLDTIFRDYEVKDKSTLRGLLSAKLDLQVLAGQYQAGLETVDALRAMQEKPAAKLTTGLIYLAAMQSAIDTKTVTGSTFEQTFTKRYSDLVNVLPWDVVQDDIRSSYASSRIYTKSAALGYLKTELSR